MGNLITSSLLNQSVSDFVVRSQRKILRPEGYSLPGTVAIAVEVSLSGVSAEGYGEGIAPIAFEKAISEAIERCTLFSFSQTHQITETSNGWAAHTSADLAIQNAILELVERDVALSTWQNNGPFYQVPKSLWPLILHEWEHSCVSRPEFFDLRILLSENNQGACVSALLFNERGNFIAGHASGLELGSTIISATSECMRAAHAAVRFEHFSDVLDLHSGNTSVAAEPGAHSLAYAYTKQMPQEVQIVKAQEAEIKNLWSRHQFRFSCIDLDQFEISLFDIGNRVVARVKNEKFKQMFWGHDLENTDIKNNNPHFVG